MTLYYATDFADRLENEIIPALRAGFVVLTDRYIFSIMARAIARGENRTWIERTAGFALVPHAVLYMRAEVKDLISRVVVGRGAFDYWESGLDLHFGKDMYESFVRYQSRLIQVFDDMAEPYGFQIIDASQSADRVFESLQRAISKVVEMECAGEGAGRSARRRCATHRRLSACEVQDAVIANQEERTRFGKSRRETVSRAAQAELRPKERRFDPLDVLRAAADGRVRQLLPIKYGRMKVSPFAFFRGAVSIMAADLGRLPHSGLTVQLCGDAHVQNLGSFAAPDGSLVFDLNDFDESIRGPWEWDVKRMAASIVLAGASAGMRGRAVKRRRRCSPKAIAARFGNSRTYRFCKWRGGRFTGSNAFSRFTRHCASRERARPSDLLQKFTEAGSRGGRRGSANLRPGCWRVRGRHAREVLDSLAAYREILVAGPAASVRSVPAHRRGFQSGRNRKRGAARLRGAV